MELQDSDVAYLLGRGGQTRARLANFSGTSLEIGNGKAEMWGSQYQIDLTLMAIDITLEQRNRRPPKMSFQELEERRDQVHIEVPMDCVGFVLGQKGATLRHMENRFKTFMFFDNEMVREGAKRLYILSPYKKRREAALKEAEDVVKLGSRRGGPPRGGRDRSPPRRRSYSRSPPRRRSRSPRRRSYSPRR